MPNLLHDSTTSDATTTAPAIGHRASLLRKHRWLTFLLPIAVFMIVGALEPTPEKAGGTAIGLNIPYAVYPGLYTLKIALTLGAILLVWPGYREFPRRVSPMAIGVGLVGIVVWIGLCRLGLEQRFLMPLLGATHLDGLIDASTRSAFNPLEQLAARPAWSWGFLAIRFLGLAAIVPLIEEFFLRGFIMRIVIQNDWLAVPMGKVNRASVIVATLLPMAMHPAELLAAAVWFSMVTWLYVRTRNVWDCVVAHAITNLLLGVYVVTTGEWQLM